MPKYYEFEVALKDIRPRIWRRFLIPTTATFDQLHQAIQDSFGWLDYHLWEFQDPFADEEPLAGLPNESLDYMVPDASKVKLKSYFSGKEAGEQCAYLYDFGDGWFHDVTLVAVRSDAASFKQRLLGGELAAPPEDCGGVPGYQRVVRFVKTGKDPYSDDPKELQTWLGDWRPDDFDLAEVKQVFDQ